MVIISQQIQISNHYDVRLKLMQYNDVNYTSIKKKFLEEQQQQQQKTLENWAKDIRRQLTKGCKNALTYMKIFNPTHEKFSICESTLINIIKKWKLFLTDSTNAYSSTNEIRKSPFLTTIIITINSGKY